MRNNKQIMFLILLNLTSSIALAVSTTQAQNGIVIGGKSPEEIQMEVDNNKKKEDARNSFNNSVNNYSTCMSTNKYVGSKCLKEFKARMQAESVAKQFGLETASAYNDTCDTQYDDYNEKFKECKPVYEKMKDKCSPKSTSGLIDDSTLQESLPLMSMISGADSIIDIYGAMNVDAQCTATREDFKQERDSMKTETDDIENKIRDLTNEMQKAQEDYAKELNDWADREREILDELNNIPLEKDKKKGLLDEQKIKAKVEADSKYNAVNEQINTLTATYLELIEEQKSASYELSDFAIFEICNNKFDEEIKAKGGTPVANALSGAFYNGRVKQDHKANSIANCLRKERQKAKRVAVSYINKLNGVKQKLESLERMRGQIAEEQKMANESINKALIALELESDSQAAKLRTEYQGIQQKKIQAQALLNQKLTTLKNDIANLTRKASILKMKLQAYGSKSTPPNADKSVETLIGECNGLDSFQEDFKEICCDGSYLGKGKNLCSTLRKPTPNPKNNKVEKSGK